MTVQGGVADIDICSLNGATDPNQTCSEKQPFAREYRVDFPRGRIIVSALLQRPWLTKQPAKDGLREWGLPQPPCSTLSTLRR